MHRIGIKLMREHEFTLTDGAAIRRISTITLDFLEQLLAIPKRKADAEGKSLDDLTNNAVFAHYSIDGVLAAQLQRRLKKTLAT